MLSLVKIVMQLTPTVYDILFCSQKPALKKVSKYENKFAKLQKKAAEFNFRNQLKVVKKKEFTLEEEDKEVSAVHCDDTHAHTRTHAHTDPSHNE
jgi:hypothetical protein